MIAAAIITAGSMHAAESTPNIEAKAPTAQTPNKSQWQFEWADEFNVTGLADSKNWSYEKGFVRNKEHQYYTEARKKNAFIEKGKLVIEAHRESFPNKDYEAGSKNWQRARKQAYWTSAALITKGKKSFLYGRIEVRARMPRGAGAWPAIWMLGTNIHKTGWPSCGEIDIMEFLGREPKTIHTTIHFKDAQSKKHKNNGGSKDFHQLDEKFHTYAIEWDKDKIDFFVDQVKIHRAELKLANQADGSNPFRKPHYLLLNLAMGGGWGGKIDPKLQKARYEIDYVRYFKKKKVTQK